ncbi:MAG: hypothetical protein KIT48_04560 [Pseudolabrys sp.]|nr:hypothetical protein [Pseudolabrys sp.]
MAQRTAITFRVSAEVLAAIDARAAAEFCKRSEAASAILDAAVARDTGAKPSPLAGMKERSTSLDLELKETRLAQIRKELLTVDAAVQVVEDVLGGMRTEGLQLMDDIAADFGLDAKELRRRFLACMAGPFSVEREPLQQLADDFAKQSLPT